MFERRQAREMAPPIRYHGLVEVEHRVDERLEYLVEEQCEIDLEAAVGGPGDEVRVRGELGAGVRERHPIEVGEKGVEGSRLGKF
ncbi:uncharacterized protein A4U43_C07F23540 [Asparagus officinalis]|uniref:Uncharacterized protein n=1 Tax=Asparagus officinalis TaxID=4686 RepID=A0A5P1EEB7_ASPOF|nr:uncharacterized protein A4U43_C07F23540 [Asparagus officinalis]